MEMTHELRERFEKILIDISQAGCKAWSDYALQLMLSAYQLDRSEWVSVRDRLPEIGDMIEVCEFDIPNKIYNFKYGNEFSNWSFTHWRFASPSPQPPNQK